MSAVLRAYGTAFDVDAFLAECDLPVCKAYRKGEPRFSSQPNGRRNEQSGVHVVASEAGFDEFDLQVADAVEFLTEEFEQVRRLCEWPGVESVSIDFGIRWRDVFAQSDVLPRELVRLADALGLGIEVSHYPIEDSP